MQPYANLKQPLAQFINSLKFTLQLRPYLTLIDLHSLQNNHPKIFLPLLGMEADELWRDISQGQMIGQAGIIRMLVKMIKKLTVQKGAFRENGQMKLLEQMKGVIEWLSGEIIGVEGLLRKKIEEGLMKERKLQKIRKEGVLQKQCERLMQRLLMDKKLFQTSISQKHQQQKQQTERTIDKQIQNNYYQYQPSNRLSQAKHTSLFIKLTPFNNHKNPQFEYKSLQKSLLKTIQEGKVEINEKVDVFKKKQREKILRKQNMEKQSCLSKLANSNREMIFKMQLQKEQLDKWEKIKMRKMIEENQKETKSRLNLIRKSLRGYSLREESKSIKQIIRTHKQSIQFINNIEEIGNLSLHKTKTNSHYSTKDLTKLSKYPKYQNDSLEKAIVRNSNSQLKMYHDTHKNLLSCRRSLVSLYDDQLREL